MKLIYCPECQDVVRLRSGVRYCQCGESYGQYDPDESSAVIGGQAIPLGIDTDRFAWAIAGRERATPKQGVQFVAFVMSEQSPAIRRMESLVTDIEGAQGASGRLRYRLRDG